MIKPICIVMATYNGAPHIEEQIASFQAQTLNNWHLLVRDDGSTDETLDILNRLALADPRIRLLDTSLSRNVGPSQNFSAALEAALLTDSTLFFISDQDDVWDREKLAIQSSRFVANGAEDRPLLVHSDLAVVDEGLNSIHPSLVKYMDLAPESVSPLNYLLTRNFVTGCAAACNRRLLETALPVSQNAIMHDWWLALVAAATGTIDYLEQPLVKYRQHTANSIGAKGFWHGLNPANNWVAGWKAGNAEYLATYQQVEAVISSGVESSDWPAGSIALLRQYEGLTKMPARCRIKAARELGLRQGNGLLQLIFCIRLLTVHGSKPPCPS